VDLTMDNITQVIHEFETCTAIKQAKRVKPLCYGEAWQTDYVTPPQTHQGKLHILEMVEATTR